MPVLHLHIPPFSDFVTTNYLMASAISSNNAIDRDGESRCIPGDKTKNDFTIHPAADSAPTFFSTFTISNEKEIPRLRIIQIRTICGGGKSYMSHIQNDGDETV